MRKKANKTLAIEKAAQSVGAIYAKGGNHCFLVTESESQPARERICPTYYQAMISRSQNMVDIANNYLGITENVEYKSGTWTKYVGK